MSPKKCHQNNVRRFFYYRSLSIKISSYTSATYLACLHDQNKSGLFGGPVLIQPIRAIWKFSKSLDWLGKGRPFKKATFVHVNRLTMSLLLLVFLFSFQRISWQSFLIKIKKAITLNQSCFTLSTLKMGKKLQNNPFQCST